ncbi:MAG: hypothetical protein A2Y10_11005 [Planctomycetes bacterium GWF2_41_51]|nr:MAG: hypothetical protein A2Y10_11005 [Planctomycetes bacterium GWF2_41_51]
MKTKFVSIFILMLVIIGIVSIDAKATFTVATFADPSRISTNPLFEVDFIGTTLNGGWSDTETGLLLDIPYSGNSFIDAWFEMTEVEIIDSFGNTGGGEINFYANGDSTNQLLTINFESGYVSRFNFGVDEIFVAGNVTITGSEITGTLSEREFSFGFANLAHLEGSQDWNDGFTATAAFTSSAIPEPATICLLGLGVLSLVRRLNKNVSGPTKLNPANRCKGFYPQPRSQFDLQ